MTTQACLNYWNNKKIKKYTAKIFEFYIKEKKAQSIARFKDIQFVLLSKLSSDKRIEQVTRIIANELYSSRDDIVKNIKEHVYSLKRSNEDIRLLSTKYILEILESKEATEVKKVLVSPDVLKIVYHSILELK